MFPKSFFPIYLDIKNKSHIGYQNSDLFWGNPKKSVLLNKDTSTIVEDWYAWICPTNRNPEEVFSSESVKGVKGSLKLGECSMYSAEEILDIMDLQKKCDIVHMLKELGVTVDPKQSVDALKAELKLVFDVFINRKEGFFVYIAHQNVR